MNKNIKLQMSAMMTNVVETQFKDIQVVPQTIYYIIFFSCGFTCFHASGHSADFSKKRYDILLEQNL